MSDGFDPGVIKKAMVSPRWAAITRLGTTVDAVGQWDAQLIRQTRVLVPIDVQALYRARRRHDSVRSVAACRYLAGRAATGRHASADGVRVLRESLEFTFTGLRPMRSCAAKCGASKRVPGTVWGFRRFQTAGSSCESWLQTARRFRT